MHRHYCRIWTGRKSRFLIAWDATIACYLTLSGAEGIKLVDSRYFIDKKVDKRHTMAAMKALQFHMTSEDVLPRQQVLDAADHLLDRPNIADLIIDNLIAWEDWTVTISW